MEAIFKALADTSRRNVLDALFANDGQTLQALCQNVDFSRQGLSKHLRILEQAGLIVTEFRGREKRHYLNPVPIHEVSERWIAKYAKEQLTAISALKQSLEGGAMSNDTFVYQTYIRAPIQKVWNALTDPEFTAQYFYATRVESTWQRGAAVAFRYAEGGDVAVEGEVIESDPPHRLVVSWHALYDETVRKEAPSRVTFSLDESNGQTGLRILHDQFPENSVLFDSISQGWPWIVAGLKSLLETGEALPRFEAQQQEAMT